MPKQQTVKASKVISKLQELVAQHGDLPVMMAIPEVGTFDIDMPRFDSDGAGDDCFIL